MSNTSAIKELAENAIVHTLATLSQGPCNLASPRSDVPQYAYVNGVLTYQGTGRQGGSLSDTERSKGVRGVRKGYRDMVEELVESGDSTWLNDDQLLLRNIAAKKGKFGNCGEHSLIAMEWLATRTPLRDISQKKLSSTIFVQRVYGTKKDNNLDHAFLLIGSVQLVYDENQVITSSDFGDETYVCDPWGYVADEDCGFYKVADMDALKQKMKTEGFSSGTVKGSLFRSHGTRLDPLS